MLTGRHALVAQLVEQRFCKPKVAGSIPAGGTSSDRRFPDSPNLPSALAYEALAGWVDMFVLVNVFRTLTDL